MQADAQTGWLTHQLERIFPGEREMVAVDVGAFRGDFTRAALESPVIGHCVAFEPNPLNSETFRECVGDHPGVTLVNLLVGRASGRRRFVSSADLATGSTLPYANPRTALLQELEIEMTTLDGWLAEHPPGGPLAVIKIDTQGLDLEVLEGAEETIRTDRPMILAELIFAPLYEGQGTPERILAWLFQRGYALCALSHENYSAEGWLAWCDAAFTPRERLDGYSEPWAPRGASRELLERIADLERVCEERLELIHRLSAEAEARLRIIESFGTSGESGS